MAEHPAGPKKPTKPRTTRAQPPAAQAEPASALRMPELIAAAEDIFLAKGYHAATMADVAKAAGMSKKTVYTLVESKADLFVALLAHHHALLKFPESEPDTSLRDQLVANLLCLARYLLSSEQISLLRLIMAEYTHSPDFGRVFLRSHVTKAKNKLECCLAEVVTKHVCLTAADPKEMAAMLFGMAVGEFHLGVLVGFRAAPTKQALEKRVHDAVDIFLAGCATRHQA
jgi:AcrR family transcriptional regulator